MPVSFSGRVEARFQVPSGGAAVSATLANGGSAVTCTVPAAPYYLTQAGGVSSLLTTLQTQLSENVQGYPVTAAAMASAVGYGTWSAGWLFNIASGNDTGAFGGITMTAVSSPTYGHAGPAGGIDKAIGFDSNADAFSAGDALDVNAAADMAWAWVGNFGTSTAVANFISKGLSGIGEGRLVVYTDSGSVIFQAFRASDGALLGQALVNDAALFTDAWHVGMATIDRATGKMQIAIRMISTGTTYVSGETTIAASDTSSSGAFLVGVQNVAATPGFKMAALYVAVGAGAATGISANISTALANFANAVTATWSVSLGSDGRITIANSFYNASIDWTSTALRDLLGFEGNLSGAMSHTGEAQAVPLWMADSPLNVDDHPSMTPEETDLRTSESPTGHVLGLAGNQKYIHNNVRYQRVLVDRIREASAEYDNASLEVFFRNAISGIGAHPWLGPASPLQVWWNNAGTLELLGADANDGEGVAGWTVVGVSKFSDIARPSQQGFVGQFDVRFPRLVSSG